jgi:sugar-specific transcriptional regulator TrmB
MDFNKVRSLLLKLDLNKLEANIYITFCEYGLQPPSVIARKLNSNRVTVYHACERLHKKGFLNKIPSNNAVKYAPKNILEIKNIYLDEKKAKDKRINEKIEVIDKVNFKLSDFGLKDYQKPYTKIYQGEGALKEIFKLSLESSEMYAYFNPWETNSPLAEINEWHTSQRMKLNIPIKIIIPKSDTSGLYIERYKDNLTSLKFIEKDKFDFKDFTIVTESRLLIYSSVDSLGVSIESNRIAANQIAIFNILWSLTM